MSDSEEGASGRGTPETAGTGVRAEFESGAGVASDSDAGFAAAVVAFAVVVAADDRGVAWYGLALDVLTRVRRGS